jgi:hypothetical protein
MSPTRVLCAFWVLAASAQAFVGGPAAVAVAAEPRVLRLRTLGAQLRAAADKPAEEAATAALQSYSIPGGCRSFNRVSFQRHFSRQGTVRKGNLQERPAEVPLEDIVDEARR